MKRKKGIESIQVFLKQITMATALLFFTAVFSQTVEISVPFSEGFIGVQGNNAQDARNITSFTTLGINKAFFVQQSSNGQFQLQGNDISGTIRLQLTSGRIIEFPGAIVWRETAQGQVRLFGLFLFNCSIS